MSEAISKAKKYRKKPIVVEADQWLRNGDVPKANTHPIDADWVCRECGHQAFEHNNCPTLEGWHIVCPGDWIIKGIKGEFYPCKPDIFEETYEPADLSPTDVDVKEVEEVNMGGIADSLSRQVSELMEENERLITKISECESHIGELDMAHRQMHARNERLDKELKDAKVKIAVLERDNDMLESTFAAKEAEYEECKADALGLHKQLREAMEIMLPYAESWRTHCGNCDQFHNEDADEGIRKFLQSVKGAETQ